MKKNLLIAIAFMASTHSMHAQVALNAENFPDANFRNALAQQFELTENSTLSAEMIANTEVLNLSQKSISDLTGIEHFNALTVLLCPQNQLTKLDLKGNPNLTTIECQNNQLAEIDLTNCPNLKALSCQNNSLPALNLTNNTNLESLCCSANSLATLDLSTCQALKGVVCEGNSLTSLNISGCDQLVGLWCGENNLAELDLSGCQQLLNLGCEGNVISTLNIDDCEGIRTLFCHNNRLDALDVSNRTDLRELWCYDNNIQNLNVEGCESMERILFENNIIEELNLTTCTELIELRGNGNRISGTNMDALIATLPITSGSVFNAINEYSGTESNNCTPEQVKAAMKRGWEICAFDGFDWNSLYDDTNTPTDIKKVAEDALIQEFYAIDGTVISKKTMKKGLYIVKCEDGTTKKKFFR